MWQRIKLWFWWNYVIDKDEFSHKLSYWYMYEKYKNRKHYSRDQLNEVISKQRNIAHRLDAGEKIKDFAPHYIEWAWI